MSVDYGLLGAIIGSWMIVFSLVMDAHESRKRSDAALNMARRAHLRLDRLNKQSPVSTKETMAISYTKGWVPADTWEDDFQRTQVSMMAKIRKWFNE